MGLFPNTSSIPTPLVVHQGQYGTQEFSNASPGNFEPTAHRIYYMPLLLPFDYTAVRIGWITGSSPSGTRDVEIGLYSNDGSRIYTTSTSTFASLGGTTYYFTPAAPWRIPAGTYYLAFQSSTTPNVLAFGTGATIGQGLEEGALLEDAASMGLPATMANAAPSDTRQPIVVLTRSAT
jgi:hypothetical protein